MSASNEAIVAPTGAAEFTNETSRSVAARFDRLVVYWGDRLNAILVKETRQALKSRQFVVTFALLLLCGWAWSLLGAALIGPEIYWTTNGPGMFFGYYVILAFPLLIVVPYGAFRSLAAEQEERTYEMLSITALGPRQIVWGKLGSAALQMLVYLSAITPCLAFTYLLRGISLPTILMVVFYTSVASLGLSMICLFLGTMTTEKYLQVILSVFAVLGLFGSFCIALTVAGGVLEYGQMAFDDSGFWIGNAAMLTFVGGYFTLIFEAAAARITFVADNRSSRLRWVMLLQFALFTGWMTLAWILQQGDEEVLWPFLVLAGLHWFVMGSMMIGESPDLSLRVRRGLPRSRLGRMFLTWFNPGPGTGLVFAVAGLVGVLLVALIAVAVAAEVPEFAQRFNLQSDLNPLYFAILGVCYGAFFLGLCLWLIRLIRRVSPVGIGTALLLQVLLVMLFSGVPAIIHLTSPTLRGEDYSLMQIVSPMWTLNHIADQGMPLNETVALLTVVPVGALLALLMNVPGLTRELDYVRIAAPERVAEDDAEMGLRDGPRRPMPTSPWDEQQVVASE